MEGGGTPYCSGMAPSGSYILAIVSQPVTEEHKQVILQRLSKGLLSWDVQTTGCDLSGLEKVCSSISAKHLKDTDVLVQYSTESLGVEVLVNPTVSTFKQCVKNLLSTSTGHKHLIHAGYTFAGSGSWILQNGSFSFDEFLSIFQQADVQSQKLCTINLHCAEIGPWNSAKFDKDTFTKVAHVALNPAEKVEHVPGSEHLISCLDRVLNSQALEEMMEASPLVGNIRFNRPTLYMFPAGQGDSALFGINGFNMLIDGGFNRKPCSWEFVRHLDRLDAVLVTRLCENNLCGVSTLMKRKSLNNTYPQIGYVFCNIAENKAATAKEDAVKTKDDLIVSVVGEGHNFIQTLNELKLKPHQCWRDSSIEPFVLYHKVGHGTLEMHVLSPPRDSKEMKEFLIEWNAYKETFSCIKSGLKGKSLENTVPLSHATSICAVIVWRPADPKDTITRILFPGSAPQNKIFESMEKLKALDILNQPVVTKSSLTSILVTKPLSNKTDKSVNRASIPNRKNTSSPALSVSSVASRNGDIGGLKKDVKETKKVIKEVKKDNKAMEVKKEVKKEIKRDSLIKEPKKNDILQKKEVPVKKEVTAKKEVKEVKKTVKKETKEVKTVSDKKTELKSAPKKVETAPPVLKTASDIKKTSTTTVRKSLTKKDASKPPPSLPKTTEAKKSLPTKASEPKAVKDVSNKKTAEAKAVAKTKPKGANAAPKASPKSKPVAVPKPGGKMTKAVAASSIVASAVAVTVAAVELNEKKDEIVEELEPEIVNESEVLEELKDIGANEKFEEEVNVSPLPPEALSPTPSESVSLTPSDTLSSAPLETVSPTPPLANEPVSTEEKDVNEIKEIESDLMPYEPEASGEEAAITRDAQEIENASDEKSLELELAKLKETDDVMSTSFIGESDFKDSTVEEVVTKAEAVTNESGNINAKLELEETTEAVRKEIDYDDADYKRDEMNDKVEEKEINIDDQLAHLSMEGSFCPGMLSYESNNTDDRVISSNEFEVKPDNSQPVSSISSVVSPKEVFPHEESFEKESIDLASERQHTAVPEFVNHDSEIDENVPEVPSNSELENTWQNTSYNENEMLNVRETLQSNSPALTDQIENNQSKTDDFEDKVESEVQEKDLVEEKCQENADVSSEILHSRTEHSEYNAHLEMQSEYNRPSEIQSSEDSVRLSMAVGHYEEPDDIIRDGEMQETSVDEPEEIARKESAVSITLNDDEPEGDYADYLRRKSGTESEDDVDIQRYMTRDTRGSFDQDKLNVKRDSESDDEDVVKSPTPHAIVDYEGHMDDVRENQNQDGKDEYEIIQTEKVAYHSEKQDFDEKDHDSAEDLEETDEGEMIRHPTPPDMKYSEHQMCDPIGQHFITTPALKPVTDITEQPLYEEAEDDESDRSDSPIVEQPVFGSTVEADFPELVTVSGGTTPSEPQSPKSAFDTKKFSENTVMDALSEHDCSESSAHSPMYQEGANAFDLQTSAKNAEEMKFDQLAETDEQSAETKESVTDENIEKLDFNDYENKLDDVKVHVDAAVNEVHADETQEVNIHASSEIQKESLIHSEPLNTDKLGVPHISEGDAASEDESCSQNDKSETEEKSDILGDDKSDVHHDDTSDIHGDDKSDNQYDEKSDIMDDDQNDGKSDIHDDTERTDSNYQDKYEKDGTDFHYGDKDDALEKVRIDYHSNEVLCSESATNADEYKCHVTDEHLANIQPENSEMSADIAASEPHDIVLDEKIPKLENDYKSENLNDRSDIEYDDQSEISENVSVEKEDKLNICEVKSDAHYVESGIHSVPAYDLSENPTEAPGICSYKEYDASNLQFGDNNVEEFGSKNALNEEHALNIEEVEDKNFKDSTQMVECENSGFIMNDKDLIITKENETPISNANFSSEVPYDEHTLENLPYEDQHENLYVDRAELHEDISPQHVENYSVIENKVLSEVSEAHQYEVLSQYEENIHTSNEAYSESSYIKDTLSSENEGLVSNPLVLNSANFNYESSEIKCITSSSTYECTDVDNQGTVSFKNQFSNLETTTASPIQTFSDEEYTESGCAKPNGFGYSATLTSQTETEENYLKSGGVLKNLQEETPAEEMYSHETQAKDVLDYHVEETIETSHTNGLNSAVNRVNFDDANPGESILNPSSVTSFGTVNGEGETWNRSSTEIVTESQFTHKSEYATGYPERVEQESSYIISSRFHSDSPEDNVMRSDSSPDVPYPMDATSQFSEIKNSVSTDKHVPCIPTKDEYPNNMNLPEAGGVPPSPNNKIRNSNSDNPYGESSEDEDSSSVPGTMSPYAYTNKAYSREEEDIDGNHIYKEIAVEKSTDVITEVDDNNPHTLTTHQVSSTTSYTQGYQEMQYAGDTNYDFHLEEWGKPMGLPTPPESSQKTVAKKVDKPATKSVKVDANGKGYSPIVAPKTSSPLKKPKPKTTKEASTSPIYLDLAYVPHHGDPQYCDVEFFKRIRARYYVFSSINPSKEVLNALLEAKKTWNEDLEVTVIPTYETDTLGYWMAQNQDDLAEYSIEVAPSASRCTVNLQDHETSCAAYRLEF